MSALGLHRCTQAFSTCSKPGLLFIAVLRFLIATASRFEAQALGAWASVIAAVGSVVVVHGLSCSSARGILVPQPGIKPVSLALTGRFLTIRAPVKSYNKLFSKKKKKNAIIFMELFPLLQN